MDTVVYKRHGKREKLSAKEKCSRHKRNRSCQKKKARGKGEIPAAKEKMLAAKGNGSR